MDRRIALLVLSLAGVGSAQGQQRSVAQQGIAPTEATAATEAGARAGGSKSTAGLGFVSGSLSLVAPGSGFLYLLFLKEGEVKPNFAEQAFLKDKSPEYVRTWSDSYDHTLTKKQKKTIIIASTVGSLAGYFLIYKPLLDKPTYSY